MRRNRLIQEIRQHHERLAAITSSYRMLLVKAQEVTSSVAFLELVNAAGELCCDSLRRAGEEMTLVSNMVSHQPGIKAPQ